MFNKWIRSPNVRFGDNKDVCVIREDRQISSNPPNNNVTGLRSFFCSFVEDMYYYTLWKQCSQQKSCLFLTCRTHSVFYVSWYVLTAGLFQSWSHSSDGGQMRGNITCQWEMKRLHVRYETEFINSGVIYICTWCQHASVPVFGFTTEWILHSLCSLLHDLFIFLFSVFAWAFLSLELLKYQGILHSPTPPIPFSTSTTFTPISAEYHNLCSSLPAWVILKHANMFICYP